MNDWVNEVGFVIWLFLDSHLSLSLFFSRKSAAPTRRAEAEATRIFIDNARQSKINEWARFTPRVSKWSRPKTMAFGALWRFWLVCKGPVVKSVCGLGNASSSQSPHFVTAEHVPKVPAYLWEQPVICGSSCSSSYMPQWEYQNNTKENTLQWTVNLVSIPRSRLSVSFPTLFRGAHKNMADT